MLYAILCYDSEDLVASWTREEEAAAMARLTPILEAAAAAGRLGPVARLMPTTTANTVRKGREAIVLDGPFAESKQQLLGFFIFDCSSLEDVLATAEALGRASSTHGGVFEVRPLLHFDPGSLASRGVSAASNGTRR